jgi:plasmid stabilization system protein ParE
MIVALELHITKRAARELNRIAEWWAVNRPAAPGAVREDLQAALALLVEQPGLGAPVLQASSRGVQRFHMDRIRYWVYYRVRGSRLEVLSVWHSSRGSAPAV